ncbi:KAP family P-loop NTPase fold protein [Neptunomonas phycophila]|uniref:KAP family P-loop NTPase fold protein n=1 Tax=Neptunomonas phycophila TaxID=1572645 RepID=UPI003736D2ED
MQKLNKDSSKYGKWFEEYNFENCKLDRSAYGNFILQYLLEEKSGFVLNLNGSSGSGKTHFVKRLYTELFRKDHPCIYIDAWESDFTNSPMEVISSELISQLDSINLEFDEDMKSLKSGMGKILKNLAIHGSGFLSKTILDDSDIGKDIAKSFLDKDSIDCVDLVKKVHEEQVSAVNKVRESLIKISLKLQNNYSAQLPVVVIVDELDRCRPSYAIEMLEVVKHFFQTDNFVFIIASDTEQLQHSIKTIYGQDFNSKRYLKRFFDTEARLPEPNIENYIKSMHSDSISEASKHPNITPKLSKDHLTKYLSIIFRDLSTELRDIDQIMKKAKSCIRNIVKTKSIDILMLYIAVTENHIDSELYKKRENVIKTDQKYPNNNNIDLNSNYLINLALTFNSLYETIDRDSHSGRDLYYTTSVNQDLFDLSNSSYNSDMYDIVRTYRTAASRLDDRVKLLTWEEYKNLVELADNLT